MFLLTLGALDRAVRIWDVQRRECNWALRGHDEWVNGVSISPDGKNIVSAGGDKTG
jgi:WD40 repeat protein